MILIAKDDDNKYYNNISIFLTDLINILPDINCNITNGDFTFDPNYILKKVEINNKKIDNKKIDNKEIDNKKIDNKEIDDKEIDNKKIDNKEIDNKEIDNKEIDDKEIEITSTIKSESSSSLLYNIIYIIYILLYFIFIFGIIYVFINKLY